ncbi:hypothetical protein [Nodularia spumigena]|uniref:hypothetical protein n=1 Tax=Nodularia spumigena TaxID=70799 RepID=UPI00232BA767|nr:hypothetical protein [Nodularia spumigena]MDB9498577.1 hypothetical protein [Nodularia spumigena CS-336/02]
MKSILLFLYSFIAAILRSNIIAGMLIALLVGAAATVFFDHTVGVVAFTAVAITSVRLQYRPEFTMKPTLFMAVASEIWLNELVVPFRFKHPWLDKIRDYSSDVTVLPGNGAAVIHLTIIGADPNVLINNTTYPIAVAQRVDTDSTATLDKFDTENTAVTDDELRGLKYDKIKSVTEQHGNALAQKQAEKAIHALAPTGDATSTPVVKTTGTARAETPTRKKITTADFISVVTRLRLSGATTGLLCAMHPYHIADLAGENVTLNNQYINLKEGEPMRFFGVDIYVEASNPIYNGSYAKKAFGAAAAPTTDRISSVFFVAEECWRAAGNKQMYYQLANTNPTDRRSVAGFRQDFLCLPKTNKGIAAIVDETV